MTRAVPVCTEIQIEITYAIVSKTRPCKVLDAQKCKKHVIFYFVQLFLQVLDHFIENL